MRTLLSVVTAALVLCGCNSTPKPAKTVVTPGQSEIQSIRDERRPTESTVIIRRRSPQPTAEPQRIKIRFQLGAGDALGQAIFENYAAIARANAGWQYADTDNKE